MKTFKKELRKALDVDRPFYSQQFEAILAAHQAEMDRVVEQVIGGDPYVPQDMLDTYQQASLGSVTQCKTAQRARYKAIKEGK